MAKKFSLEAAISLTDGITSKIGGIESKMTGFSKRMKKNFGGLGNNVTAASAGIDRMAKGALIGMGAAAAGVAVVGKSFIDAGAEVEKYKAVLKTMLGSQDAANARFEEYSKLAASTPFELNDVVELGNGLQALGRYSKENLIMLGDLAAASGKPIDQVRGAFAKLASGQKGEAVNMFRDLLISTADWSAATGKGISKTGELMATTDELIAALPKIMGKKGFAGMMDNLSKSYTGMESNFQDTITRFRQQIGGTLLPYAKDVLGALTEAGGRFSDSFGTKSKAGIDRIGAAMSKVAEWIRGIDFGKVIDDVIKFGESVASVARFLQPLGPYLLIIIAAIKIMAVVMAVFNAVAAANPMTLIVLAIIAAIAALILIIKLVADNWGAVSAFIVSGLTGALEVIKTIGATILDVILLPLRAVLTLISKIPGMADKLKPMTDLLDAVHGQGIAGKIESKTSILAAPGVAAAPTAAPQAYASPTTRGSDSRTYAESRSTATVFVRPDKGAAISPTRGGPPARTLNYGQVQ